MIFFRKTISAQLHFIGCIAAIIGMFVLQQQVSQLHSANHFLACLIYGTSSILVFAVSAIYHFLHDGFTLSKKWAERMEIIDHFAIYFFIAGSYTIIILNAVKSPWSRILLVTVWTFAAVGVIYTLLKPRLPLWAQHRFFYTGLFVGMGWLMFVRIGEIIANLNQRHLLVAFILGGASYSFGAILYATKWPKLFEKVFGFHEIWHIMVIGGYCFHFYVISKFYSA